MLFGCSSERLSPLTASSSDWRLSQLFLQKKLKAVTSDSESCMKLLLHARCSSNTKSLTQAWSYPDRKSQKSTRSMLGCNPIGPAEILRKEFGKYRSTSKQATVIRLYCPNVFPQS